MFVMYGPLKYIASFLANLFKEDFEVGIKPQSWSRHVSVRMFSAYIAKHIKLSVKIGNDIKTLFLPYYMYSIKV